MSTGADMMLSTERESSAFDSAPDYPGLASPTYDQVCIVATTSHDAAHHLFLFSCSYSSPCFAQHTYRLSYWRMAQRTKRGHHWGANIRFFFSQHYLGEGLILAWRSRARGVGAERSLRSWVSTRRVSCLLPGHDEGTKLSDDDDDDGLDSSWWREGGSSCCTKGRTLATTERDGQWAGAGAGYSQQDDNVE